jgi:hypothetical protein
MVARRASVDEELKQMAHVKYDPSEIMRRGKEIYEREIRAKVETGNRGKMLAIDTESGDYELGADSLTAFNRLATRKPDAPICIVRIGYPTAVRIGKGRE